MITTLAWLCLVALLLILYATKEPKPQKRITTSLWPTLHSHMACLELGKDGEQTFAYLTLEIDTQAYFVELELTPGEVGIIDFRPVEPAT